MLSKDRPIAIRILVAALLLTLLPGCGSLYLMQAARGQWQLMRERQPISRVLANPETSEELRSRLLEITEARDFASKELGLPDNGSYRTYADLGRPYVVWNVVATPEFSVEPRKWCFPIVGCVAYRGYFSEASARAFAERLKKQGHDVVVGGVVAYSTLGRFADPVLNTMLGYGDVELAAIMFHELAHQVIYVAGDTAFNEAFAVAVEREGLERWLRARGRIAQLERYRQRSEQQLNYIRLFERTRAELARLYRSGLPEDTMRARKREIFMGLQREIQELEEYYGVPAPYRSWVKEGLNNAHLASVATYYDCVPGFERLLKEQGGDLEKFYAAVKALASRPKNERHAVVCNGSES